MGALRSRKEDWRANIPFVGTLIENQSPTITAKSLWMLGEMGLQHPEEIAPYVSRIASFMKSPDALLRERALNALGRIGRARFETIQPNWEKMFEMAHDSNPRVRLAFIWASENIATNTPDIYGLHLPLYAEMLHDTDDKVRMEAPEMFRVLGKRRPKLVEPYIGQLRTLSETDSNRVVRIHCLGAIRTAQSKAGAIK